MSKHTAQSLGKYLGRKIFIDSKGSGLTGTAILNGVDMVEGYLSIFDNLTQIHQDFKLGSGNEVYPILKTVEQMEGVDHFYMQDIDYEFEHFGLSVEASEALLWISAGAEPHKQSPTGYISIHDGLPCEVDRETNNDK
jgi:hypothetical protein